MATIPEPLFFTEDNNLQIMTANDIAEIVQQVIALLADDKSVTLFNDTQSNLSSAGRTLVEGLPIADTRLSSGEAAVGGSSHPAEGTTGEPETVTTNFNQVGHTTTSGLTLPTLTIQHHKVELIEYIQLQVCQDIQELDLKLYLQIQEQMFLNMMQQILELQELYKI